MDVTTSNFQKEVIESNSVVVVDLFAIWCGPCRAMSPIFKDLEGEMPDVKFVKVDVDSNSELAQQFNVKSIPTFLVMRAGEVVKTIVGAQSKNAIKTLIESVIK